jgi:hypothetical protein
LYCSTGVLRMSRFLLDRAYLTCYHLSGWVYCCCRVLKTAFNSEALCPNCA